MEVSCAFTFDAAHYLTNLNGKCENLHGHTYTLTVTVSGPVKNDGLVIDFHIFKEIVRKKVLAYLDHKDLNAIFKNPSAEHIAMWIWKKLHPFHKLAFPKLKLVAVTLCETPGSCVTYRG